MRIFASLLIRWVTAAGRHLVREFSRPYEAEFPDVTQTAYEQLEWTLRGSRTLDGACSDALRPHSNWINIEDQHDNSLIGEKWAAAAGRLAQKGRISAAQFRRAGKARGQANALGKNCGIFQRRKTNGAVTHAATGAEWRINFAACAFVA